MYADQTYDAELIHIYASIVRSTAESKIYIGSEMMFCVILQQYLMNKTLNKESE